MSTNFIAVIFNFNFPSELERSLVSMEQIEISRFMRDLGTKVDKNLMNLAMQFGYIGMFMCVFPAAAVWGFIANVIMIILTEKAYSKIARRSLSREMENIGVWNDVFMLISFISTVINAMFVAFTSQSMNPKESYGTNLQKAERRLAVFIIVVLAEHSIIMFKYFLARVIPDIPTKIEKRRKNAIFLEQKAKETFADQMRETGSKQAMKTLLSPRRAEKFKKYLKKRSTMKKMQNLGILKQMVLLTSKGDAEGAINKYKKIEEELDCKIKI